MWRARFTVCAAVAVSAAAQTTPRRVTPALEARLNTPDVVAYQLKNYLRKKAPRLQKASSAPEWSTQAASARKKLLSEVVFHGWPRAWVESEPRFEDLGEIPSGPGYRMRKLRYEIVPGFHSSAILYTPENLSGKVPAMLNVNGHVGPPGKSVEYKQKRCINQARMGMLSLNLEWLAYGELNHPENAHWFGAHLDLAGSNAAGLFYLAMRRGLDYLAAHPSVDTKRIGVTGLSGGGWQTIILSALDERVALSIPVAGYSSVISRLERAGDIGDVEQNATDLLNGQDYDYFTAMLAPRPALLIYNAEDDCCFRAPLVQRYIFDSIQPFYALYRAQDRFAWHENADPADHNYQLDNRVQSYRFIAKHFDLRPVDSETAMGDEIKSFEELVAGLKDNLTILGVARKLASAVHRPRTGASRERLREVVRYRQAHVSHAWALQNTKSKGLETRSFRFDFDNGLSATGVWLKAIAAPSGAPATIILNDKGRAASTAEVSERVNRGEQVLSLDLLFTGDSAPEKPGPPAYTQLLATLGDRPLGLEAAQLLAAARWLRAESATAKVRLETDGIRMQVIGAVAAALEPGMLSKPVVRNGMVSLSHLLDKPVEYQAAPDLFCLDLLKEFDLEDLARLNGT
jgi:hypothetical protein